MHQSFVFILFLNTINFQGQDLKLLDNEIVSDKIEFKNDGSSIEIHSSIKDLELSKVSIVGDRSNNTITLDFFLSHTLSDPEFELHVGRNRPIAYDSLGNEYKYDKVYFNFKRVYGTGGVIPVNIPTGTIKKGQITFDEIPSGLVSIELVKINYYLTSSDNKKDKVEGFFLIRNIPVLWN